MPVLVIARLCKPSSELHVAEHFHRQTALPDILGVPDEKVNDSRLHQSDPATSPAARGFRNFANYRTRILFFCGKLNLQPEYNTHYNV